MRSGSAARGHRQAHRLDRGRHRDADVDDGRSRKGAGDGDRRAIRRRRAEGARDWCADAMQCGCVCAAQGGVRQGGYGGNGFTGATKERRRTEDEAVRLSACAARRQRGTRDHKRKPFPFTATAFVCDLLRPVGRLRRQSNGCYLSLIPAWVNHTLDAFDQAIDVEVDHEADWQVCEPQVSQNLCLMDRKDLRDRLHFNYDGVVHEQIQTVMTIERDALVGERYPQFGDEGEFARRQFTLQTGGVGRLEQAGSEIAVNFDRCCNDVTGDVVERWLRQHADVISKTGTSWFYEAIRERRLGCGKRRVLDENQSTKKLKTPFVSVPSLLL